MLVLEGVERRTDRGRRHMGLRLAALAALLALVLGAAACGDSDDEGSDGNGGQAAAQDGGSTATTADNSPEGQVRATYGKFVEAFYSKDAKGVCEVFGPIPRKQAMTKPGVTCEEGFGEYLEGLGTMSKHKPYVVKLRVDGPSALAQVRTKTSDIYPVRFDKLDGEWKINARWR